MKTVEFKRPDGKALQMEVIKYNAHEPSRNKTPDRHRHNFHSIFFIQEGISEQEVDFEAYALQANQIMLIPQDAVHWEKETHHLKGYVVLFKAEFFSFAQKVLLDGLMQYAVAMRKLLLTIPTDRRSNIEMYFELLYQEQFFEDNQNQTFILQNIFLALLNKLEGLLQTKNIHSFITHRQVFQQFITLIEENYKTQKPLDFYINELQTTRRSLNKILKELIGKTAQDLIIERIILDAKRELCYYNKSVKEIAFELGYDNQYYFSRIFKKRTTFSPEEFRKQFAQ